MKFPRSTVWNHSRIIIATSMWPNVTRVIPCIGAHDWDYHVQWQERKRVGEHGCDTTELPDIHITRDSMGSLCPCSWSEDMGMRQSHTITLQTARRPVDGARTTSSDSVLLIVSDCIYQQQDDMLKKSLAVTNFTGYDLKSLKKSHETFWRDSNGPKKPTQKSVKTNLGLVRSRKKKKRWQTGHVIIQFRQNR